MMTQEEFFKRFTYSVSADRIGGGGFGTVYKAKDNVLHRTVAIKVSEVKTTADGQKTFSLKDEFEALNHVPKHPNIANYEEFYSFESPQGIFDYAIMQYYPDGNLSTAIKQGLTAKQKEDIATQLLEGIAFLHEHKVVHRDLKPGNILIVKDGDKVIPLITDFGLSKAADMGDGSLFSNSFGGGTQRYSSPEQLQGKPLRLNTDLWSYGAILYELFTGEQLFSAGSGAANSAQADLEIYNKIVNGDVSSLGVMPEKWRKVAERCLVVDADKRAKDEAELHRIISGETQEDETVANAVGSGGLQIRPTGNGDLQSPADEEGTVIANQPQPKPKQKKQQPIVAPSTPSTLRQAQGLGSEGLGTSKGKPKGRKGLWIALAGVAVAAIAVVLLLRQPKQESNEVQISVTGSFDGHDYVDLGLPSGTLWATCNIGASKPEDYGDYYAWGETKSKTTYNWDTYIYANGTYDKLTKYCNDSYYGNNGFTDNLTTLQSGDDPATANWGSGWQTPSKDQWEELKINTTNQWTTKNGVKGRLFTSKKNGQTLFLPAAGYRNEGSLHGAGSYGYYWSRSLDTGYSYDAWSLHFLSDVCGMLSYDRYDGQSVRPVRSARQN